MSNAWRRRILFKFSVMAALIAIAVISNGCSRQLPARYDPTAFTPEHGFPEPSIRLGDGPDGRFLIVVPVEGAMAFTTPSNYLGLYGSSGNLEDEVRLGAFPVDLVSWDAESIVLRSTAVRGDSTADREYVRASVSRLSHLGPYRLQVLVQ